MLILCWLLRLVKTRMIDNFYYHVDKNCRYSLSHGTFFLLDRLLSVFSCWKTPTHKSMVPKYRFIWHTERLFAVKKLGCDINIDYFSANHCVFCYLQCKLLHRNENAFDTVNFFSLSRCALVIYCTVRHSL